MEQNLMEPSNSESMETPKTRRPKRAGKRKMGFRMEAPPFPVRAIWELATDQERQDAHKTGVLMLEHWLGRMTRKQLGEKLDMPPLRIWQMSQQALAGMVVGIMAQPKRPPKGTEMPTEDKKLDRVELKALRAENLELKEQNRVLQSLLDLLKDMPDQAAALKAPKGKKISPKVSNPMQREGRNLAPES